MRDRVPARHAAAPRPVLDCFQDRLRLVAEDPAVEVDQQQRGLFAEADRPGRFHGEMRLILLGQKTIPDTLSHKIPPPRPLKKAPLPSARLGISLRADAIRRCYAVPTS